MCGFSLCVLGLDSCLFTSESYYGLEVMQYLKSFYVMRTMIIVNNNMVVHDNTMTAHVHFFKCDKFIIISSLCGLGNIGFHVEMLKELTMKRLNQPLVDA